MQIVFMIVFFGFILGSLCDVVALLVHSHRPEHSFDEVGLQHGSVMSEDVDNVKGQHRV